MARRLSILLLLVAFTGCSNKDEAVNPPSVSTPSKYFYTLVVNNAQPFDTSVAQYVLWFRKLGDSNYRTSIPLPFWVHNGNSLVFSGSTLVTAPDSITDALVSLEPKIIPTTPSSPLVQGLFYARSFPASSLTADSGIGNYGDASGSALFTTKSSDTNRARSEFYLMQFVSGSPVSSMSNLPLPPKGWTYGLWVLDSNYYPLHKFFYGAFTSPVGHDSDPTTDAYPYPGGFKPPPLNDPGAKLEITLEPTFELKNGKITSPSPFVALYTKLQRFINFDQSLRLTNVWAGSAPSGTLTLTKQ